MNNLIAALLSNIPFGLAYKRAKCISNNHISLKGATTVDTLQSEKHPHTDKYWLYTVNIMKCSNCGMLIVMRGLRQEAGKRHGKKHLTESRDD
jgi:hypothetical protein